MPSHSVNVPNEWMATDTLSGLVGFLLLPLFHLQLFFFLLESMGGSGFIACVGWALVPSITTRIPRLGVLAQRYRRRFQAAAAIFLTGSLAAGAAGFMTARLALASSGLALSWGLCQTPLYGGPRGQKAVDGLIAGNHLALMLRLWAGLELPPSPRTRFLRSLPLPVLMIVMMLFFDTDPYDEPLFPYEGISWNERESHSGVPRDGDEGRRCHGSDGRDMNGVSVSGLDARAIDGGDNDVGAEECAALELVDRNCRRNRSNSRGDSEGLYRDGLDRMDSRTSVSEQQLLPPMQFGANSVLREPLPSEGAPELQRLAQSDVEDYADPSSTASRNTSSRAGASAPCVLTPIAVGQAPLDCLPSFVASLAFGGLLFLTVLLAGTPWTGDEWAPSPGLRPDWAGLRLGSVVFAWGFGRSLISVFIKPSSRALRSGEEAHPTAAGRNAGQQGEAAGGWLTASLPPAWRWLFTRSSLCFRQFGPLPATPALILLVAVAALAVSPHRPAVVVPAVFVVALMLPSLWYQLEALSRQETGQDGAVVYSLLTVWETALVAFEYAPPLRPLRNTRPALLIVSALMATAPAIYSLVFAHCSRRATASSARSSPPSSNRCGHCGQCCIFCWCSCCWPRLCCSNSARHEALSDSGSRSAGTGLANRAGNDLRAETSSHSSSGGGSGGVNRFLEGNDLGVVVADDYSAVSSARQSQGQGSGTEEEKTRQGTRGAALMSTTRSSTRSSSERAELTPAAPGLRASLPAGRYRRRSRNAHRPVRDDGIFAATLITMLIAAGLTGSAPSTDDPDSVGVDHAQYSCVNGSEKGDRNIRLVNFNVYMGYDRLGEDNTFRVGRLLEDLKADVAALQETGLMRLTLGNRNYAAAVARAAGMVLAASPPVSEETWGCAILSRLPVISSGWRRLPRGSGENACEAYATVSLGEGRGIATVINVHLGNEGTQDNDDQVTDLLDLLRHMREHEEKGHDAGDSIHQQQSYRAFPNDERNVQQWQLPQQQPPQQQQDETRRLKIVMGDFNFDSSSSGYRRLVEDGGLKSAGSLFAPRVTPANATHARNGSGSGVDESDDAAAAAAAAINHDFVYHDEKVHPANVQSSRGKDDEVDAREANHAGKAPKRAGKGWEMASASNGNPNKADGWGGERRQPVPAFKVDSGKDDTWWRQEEASAGRGGNTGGWTAAEGLQGFEDGLGDVQPGKRDRSRRGRRNVGVTDDDGGLDFVFFEAGSGVSCTGYDVHREYSQERYADGYPSVTNLSVMCPLPR